MIFRMRLLIGALVLTAGVVTAPALSSALENRDRELINKSVVKVFSTYRSPNFYQPWQYKSQKSGIGSGVIIAGERILTNAHNVNNAVYIEVKKANDPQRYIGYIEAVGHQQDLAVIKIKNPTFFRGTRPMPVGDLPDLLDQVSVYGFPQGGSEISITQGVVSRIEQTRYAHSGVRILGVQIDAAINPGNSGGPVVKKGRLVGIAMQALRSGENIGYLIPTPIIDHFLADIKDGRYDGFPEDGLRIQLAENRSLRDHAGMAPGETGVIVNKVIYGSSAYGVIEPGDVILAIDGVSVANDASVPLDDNKRVDADFLIQRHQVGESLKVKVIRGTERIDLTVPLKRPFKLVRRLFDERPSYVIFGGFVFTPLTINFLKEWGRNWYKEAPYQLMAYANEPFPTEERREVVVMRSALPHDMNAGYHSFYNHVVKSVNGQMIGSLGDLYEAVKKSEGKYTVVEFEQDLKVVIDTAAARRAEGEILRRYGINSPASDDLR